MADFCLFIVVKFSVSLFNALSKFVGYITCLPINATLVDFIRIKLYTSSYNSSWLALDMFSLSLSSFSYPLWDSQSEQNERTQISRCVWVFFQNVYFVKRNRNKFFRKISVDRMIFFLIAISCCLCLSRYLFLIFI